MFEYLSIPLDGSTELELPYTIYDSDQYSVILKLFNEQDLERAFRLRFESDEQSNSYRPVYINTYDHFDDNMTFALHGRQLQICAIPKSDTIDEAVREKISIGLGCALGFFDEYASWVYDSFSTVVSRGAYRSHRSARGTSLIGQKETLIIKNVLAYRESEQLPQHKFDTLRALLNAARHQASASDVACVLYFSALEAIFVDDNKELGYKLSIRLTRHLNEDFDYFKHITKLYGKRGKVIHGSNKGDIFTQKECRLIESLAKDAFIEMLANPTSFTERELDGLLLA
jgi:hypothetical protein